MALKISSICDWYTSQNQESFSLPVPLQYSLKISLYAHFYLCTIHRLALYSRYKFLYAAGATINYTWGENKLVRVGAQVILIMRQISKCNHQTLILRRKWENVLPLFKNTYPLPKVLIQKYLDTIKIPYVEQLPLPLVCLIIKTEIMAYRLWELVQALFFTSVAFLELMEAFFIDQFMEFECITASVIHLLEIYKEIQEDLPRMMYEMESNKKQIDQVLFMMNSSWKTKDLNKVLYNIHYALQVGEKGIKDIIETAKDISFDMSVLATGAHIAKSIPSHIHMDVSYDIKEYPHDKSRTYPPCEPRLWDTRGRFYSTD